MSSRKTIPPLLEPYLRLPPEASLLLLTGVLDATPHWLTARVLRSAYGDSASANTRGARQTQEEGESNTSNGGEDIAVVLVSWLRDWEFWKGEARRGAGLDLPRLAQENRFAFVDGLTSLFGTAETQPNTPLSASPLPLARALVPAPSPRGLSVRGGPLPARGAAPPPAAAATPTTAQSQTQPQIQEQKKPISQKNLFTLTSPSLAHAQETITNAINALTLNTTQKVLLILDSPTLPLALSPPFSVPNGNNTPTTTTTTSTTLLSTLLTLRSHARVHSTLISLESDLPFLSPSASSLQQAQHNTTTDGGPPAELQQMTPLETEIAAFVAGVAHQSRWVVGVRGLDTGVARDVSGVVRVSRGGSWGEDEDEDGDGAGSSSHGKDEEEMEVLYFVQGDGGVKVFERGGGNIG